MQVEPWLAYDPDDDTTKTPERGYGPTPEFCDGLGRSTCGRDMQHQPHYVEDA